MQPSDEVPETIKEKALRLHKLKAYLRDVVPQLESERSRLENKLAQEFIDQEIQKQSWDVDGERISFSLPKEPKLRASYRVEDRARIVRWLQDNGCGSLAEPKIVIHPATLNATVSDLMKQGVAPPPELKTFHEWKLSWRRSHATETV